MLLNDLNEIGIISIYLREVFSENFPTLNKNYFQIIIYKNCYNKSFTILYTCII